MTTGTWSARYAPAVVAVPTASAFSSRAPPAAQAVRFPVPAPIGFFQGWIRQLRRRALQPFPGLGEVLCHALAVGVHKPEIGFRFGVLVKCRQAKPPDGHRVVLWDAASGLV